MKLFRNVAVMMLALALLVPTVAFADEAVTPEDNRVVRERQEKPEKEEREKQDFDSVVQQYLPARYDEWLSKKAEHESLHESLKTLAEEQKSLSAARREVIKGEMEVVKASIKEQIENEEITRDEAKIIIDEARAPYEADRAFFEGIKSEKESLKALKESNRAARDAIRVPLVELIKNEGDASEIASMLNQLMELQQEHLNLDYTGLALRNQVIDFLK